MTNIKTGEIWVAAICVKYGTLISNPSSEIMRSLVDFFEVAIAFCGDEMTITLGKSYHRVKSERLPCRPKNSS